MALITRTCAVHAATATRRSDAQGHKGQRQRQGLPQANHLYSLERKFRGEREGLFTAYRAVAGSWVRPGSLSGCALPHTHGAPAVITRD